MSCDCQMCDASHHAEVLSALKGPREADGVVVLDQVSV